MSSSSLMPTATQGSSIVAASTASSGDFETFYHSVCSDLQTRGEVQPMSKLFSHLTTDEDRMRFVFEKNFDRSIVNSLSKGWDGGGASPSPNVATSRWKDLNFSQKDRAESQRLRNLGNQVYQKNKLTEALELYSASICCAPHPAPPTPMLFPTLSELVQDTVDTFSHDELALGYANRSAVLFQMREFELCIRDITRAFDNSYPNNLMYKLFERKARCLKALKDYPRALESMKSAEMWMKYSTLTETKSSSFKKEIAKQVEQLEELVSAMSLEEFSDEKRRRSQTSPVSTMAAPTLDVEENKELPGVRKDLRMMYSEDKGRHLVASQDIFPGETLIVETPYSSILLPEFYNTHCQTCFQRLVASVPCWCCSKVRFCCDDCRNEAWDRFHKVECQQLNLLLDSGVGKNALLAFRILTSSGKIYLEYVVSKLSEETETRRKLPDGERLIGFNEDGVYDSADYRTVHSLVANSKHRGVGDLFKRALMAQYLVRVLEMTPFFYNGGSDPRNVKLADKIAMGSVLLRHLQNLPCNAHEINELELTNPAANAKDSTVNEVGAAVFGVLSLLNHSCDPNVVRHSYGCTGVVRAIRTIKKGEEVLDNYGYHYAVMPKEERQRKLHNQYYFHCACLPCARNWPTYASLNASVIPLPNGAGDHKAVLADYARLSRQFKRAFDQVVAGSFEQALPVLLEFLRFLDANVTRPLREYNDCQEAIKQCYSAMANCHKARAIKKDKDLIV